MMMPYRVSVTAYLLLAGCLSACSPSAEPTSADRPSPQAVDAASPQWFEDRAEASGLRFVHFNGMSGQFYQPEIAAPGVGMVDVDNDGDLDVYLVQGEPLGGGIPRPAPPEGPLGDRLFRNDLVVSPDGTRTLRFTDVTDQAGLSAARGYGMGITSGDYDNDGWVDLYLTRFGPNQMFRNRGDGTFVDVSIETGTADPAWSIPASFFDYDRDGWLDLFVGNYMNYTLATHTPCFFQAGPRDYCPPNASPAHPNVLYRNQGDGTFAVVTEEAGLAAEFGPALGSATADYDNDGWIDLFVANDEQENQLWINQRDGTFRNLALLRGTALGATGSAKADMGVDAGDFDNDGDEDLIVTELTGQGSTLYVNDGTGLFADQGARYGIRGPSLPHTGFGTGWLDIDLDGWLDIVAVNGFVTQRLEAIGADVPFPMDAPNQLFRNLAGERFEEVTTLAGSVFSLSEVSRGAALGDIDNDGDPDVLVGNDAGPVRLLVNVIETSNHWVGMRLVGRESPRDMVGARVALVRADGAATWRRARADGSYASSNDPRVVVGLGESADFVAIRVIWPTGRSEEWSSNLLRVDQYVTLTEGTGEALSSEFASARQ